MIQHMLTLAAAPLVDTGIKWHQFEVWQLLLITGGCLVVIGFIGLMYYFDSVELPIGTTVLLAALRLVAFAGLLVFFLGPEKRTETTIVKNSRVPVLIDTSVSMTLPGVDDQSELSSQSRIEQVVAELQDGHLIKDLRRQHDVVIYRFDEQSMPYEIASLPRLEVVTPAAQLTVNPKQRRTQSLTQARRIAFWGGALLLLSLVTAAVFFWMRSSQTTARHASWAMMASVLSLVACAITLAVANLSASHTNLLVIVGLKDEKEVTSIELLLEAQQPERVTAPKQESQPPIDWKTELAPGGSSTRLFDVISSLVNKELGGPVAGVVIATDGQNNEGLKSPRAIVKAKLPIYFIGLGSIEKPKNVRLAKLQAPRRVFPGDEFKVRALIQSFGMESEIANLKLVVSKQASGTTQDINQNPDGTQTIDPDSQLIPIDELEDAVELIEDGKEVAVEFTIKPEEEGTLVFRAIVEPFADEQETRDNQKTIRVEVVERKNKVFLLAGGPMREFRFLRSQLLRDDEIELHVWLQTGRPGMGFDRDRETLLYSFPDNEDEMFEYDCVVAFDPDWRVLTAHQCGLLERWVDKQAGGLIVVAGPVYTPRWTSRPADDERINTFRGLYPVTFFHRRAPTVKLGRFGGEKAWQLSFTREGRAAEFLWLSDAMSESEANWNAFAGVYGYYAVDKLKGGARAFAYFSDPATKTLNGLPVYLAGHFYGAGRVFFQASGEMWRIRELDDKFFEKYYTKLIRWASQGRLLRDSERGVLLVDRDECLVSDIVQISAILTNAQHEPLMAEQVSAILVQPDQSRETLTLRQLKGRPGTFVGQFVAKQPGDHRVALAVPESRTLDVLTATVSSRMPRQETEKAERNDPVMSRIAAETQGEFYVGFAQANNGIEQRKPLSRAIKTNDQVTTITGNPDGMFTKRLMEWLLGIICGVLCVEWIIRRLSRLA